MSIFEIKKSDLSLPEGRRDPVAVAYGKAIIIWGGDNNEEEDVSTSHVDYHVSGKWTRIVTTGESPPSSSGIVNQVQVVNGKMMVLDADRCCHSIIYSLDLKMWMWERFIPSGIQPPKSTFMSSFLYDEKIYFFGGKTKLTEDPVNGSIHGHLFCYNIETNAWEWPNVEGEIPSPRNCHLTIISGDTAFLFGGSGEMWLNDLYTLDMPSMRWRKVHDNHHEQGEAPNGRDPLMYTLTIISEDTAVLFGGDDTDEDNSWLLDLHNAKHEKDPSSVWTRIPNHFSMQQYSGYAAVLEPVSQTLWVLGGQFHGNRILKMSYKLASLKDLAMDKIARINFRLLPGQIPTQLRNEIATYKDKNGEVLLCSREGGCTDCQPE